MTDLFATRFFKSFAWKQLRKIDLPNRGSNQHELQGISALRRLLGSRKREGIRALWRRFDSDGDLVESTESDLTWYDARETNAGRSAEWRLYYPANTPLENAEIGDLLIVAVPNDIGVSVDADLLLYVINQDSDLHDKVLWALGLEDPSDRFTTLDSSELNGRRLQVYQEDILGRLEPRLIYERLSSWQEELVEEEFADFLEQPRWEHFPSTSKMAAFAWSRLSSGGSSWDNTLMELLEMETRAFLSLEKVLLDQKLENGFKDADDFLEYALKVQNRRKSRRGFSLELHLEWIFKQNELVFQKQVTTEGRSTVDFLFPNRSAYVDLDRSNPTGVVMLAAKTTCKDRWRQVLAEATKLKNRHLFTLEPSISSTQTHEMGRNRLSLVVPEPHLASYSNPGTDIVSLDEFISFVRREIHHPVSVKDTC